MDKILELLNKDYPDEYGFLRLSTLNIYPFPKKVLLELLMPKEIYDEKYNSEYDCSYRGFPSTYLNTRPN